MIPADILLVKSSGVKGVCYVETKNLDGETNLKNKLAPKHLNDIIIKADNLVEIKDIQISCEPPNKEIYKFDGNLLMNYEHIALNNDNILLRGMSLRNTEFVYGLIIYTGPESKM
jgi:phospholipid-transporting ATPase